MVLLIKVNIYVTKNNKNNEGNKIIKKLKGAERVLSPFSISMALMLAANGANGRTYEGK
jgi:hypothetical protein